MHSKQWFHHMLFTTRIASNVDERTRLFGAVVLIFFGEIFIVVPARAAMK
jgi:hypothetical protein